MRKAVVSSTHWSSPNRMKVPPSMMKPAGKMALTPQMDRYLPTRGPEGGDVSGVVLVAIQREIEDTT